MKNGNGTSNKITIGTMQYANGNKYNGEWKNDKKTGKGILSLYL